MMNSARNQFLAGPRFPKNQSRSVSGRDGLHLLQNSLQASRATDNLVELVCRNQLFFEVLLLFLAASERLLESFPFGEVAHHHERDSPSRSFHWAEQNIHGELTAVLVTG